jgi:hypothetical protein
LSICEVYEKKKNLTSWACYTLPSDGGHIDSFY